ncbi:Rho guanine nucleotide exchange factor 10-like protein [Papilio machaon]|uniref:Rho guanine nucleotide exchange factor 10-like protein n=1 Tax=Papilio machaon TaxID=76193 RepID=A0A194QT03_PAPMA|nr:Rho guanine nucleotide exchange factor 10-like protein [Papilio machaon]
MHTHDTDKMPKLPEIIQVLSVSDAKMFCVKILHDKAQYAMTTFDLEEDMFSCGGEVRGGRVPPPSLGPPPDALTAVQLRRRHVVAAIIHSENSYVATLQRLVNDYKKPLEESSPAILNASKIQTLFHRLPDILQCHLHFRTALADCAATWDRDEKIGEVFLNAFSKAVVLDVYSDFINNFSVAMELAKMESKRKSALADFFKVKQISAHDRLSFFGLMVKPVQRFPQFIMFLQDLLKHTPPGHADRVALQRALTRLEALAEALNERKRDAERTQAFRAALRRLTRGGVAGAGGAGGTARFGAARLLASRADRRHLLRQDDLLQLEFNQSGALTKCKPRRLLLLNDLVVCVSVGAGGDAERLGLKWAHPVHDVDVLDTGTSPTLSRVLAQGMNRSGSLRSNSSNGVGNTSTSTGDSLCNEMSALMHDYEAVSRMADLAASLHAPYPELAPDMFRTLLQNIQKSIQVGVQHLTVRCGCFYVSGGGGVGGGGGGGGTRAGGGAASRRARSLLWVCAGGAQHSHVAVLAQRAASLKTLATLHLPDTQVTSMEYAKGVRQVTTLCGDTVWLGTEDKKIIIFSGVEPEKQEKLTEVQTVAGVTQVRYHCDAMFVGLANGRLTVYRRSADDTWALHEPLAIELGDQPVHCVLPVDGIVYATCARRVFAINALTAEIMRILELKGEGDRSVKYLAHSGVGLWTAFSDSTYVSLYHAETFEHLQNIDIAADVAKTIGAREGSKPAYVSALLASQGLLWVGTTAGVSVTVPLPKLEGLPLIGGHIAVSYHAHAGPVTFLLSLLPENREVDVNVVRRNLSNARALADTTLQEFKEEEAKDSDKPKLERRISEESSPYRPQRVQSAVVRRKKPGDVRLSKTLPKCANLNACDVYGLFGDLMFVKDCVGDADVSGSGGEALRRSDPELAAIPFRVSTLDRRLRMRAGRPRSLDLSSWSVDSRASSLCTSSGSEESMALRGVSRTSSGASGAANLAPLAASTPDSSSSKSSTSERSISRSDSTNAVEVRTNGKREGSGERSGGRSLRGADYMMGCGARRSVVTVAGGRGYVDWRQTADAAERPAPAADPNPKDAHLILWEMRL